MIEQALRTQNHEPSVLKQAWRAYRGRHPYAPIPQIATALRVSEAELVAAHCGHTATRLMPAWSQMVLDLQSFGKVSAKTRNAGALLQHTGHYQNIECNRDMAIVHGHNLEAGFNFTHWHSAFAVEEKTEHGPHHSLKFYDGQGAAVHEIRMTRHSCLSAYRSFIRNYKAPDNFAAPLVASPLPPAPGSNDPITAEKLQRHWQTFKKVQDFSQLLTHHGLTRYQALQLAGPRFAVAIKPAVFLEFMRTLADIALPVMIYINNKGSVQIHHGSLETIKVFGATLSILNECSELHFNVSRLDSVWVVKKPLESGLLSSLELYDAQKQPIALIYGRSDDDTEEDGRWRELTETLSFSTR
ncbi:MAG: ChuX/HutX family heme-like substrate-binding protein [Gammaproteobacteria bacterium]